MTIVTPTFFNGAAWTNRDDIVAIDFDGVDDRVFLTPGDTVGKQNTFRVGVRFQLDRLDTPYPGLYVESSLTSWGYNALYLGGNTLLFESYYTTDSPFRSNWSALYADFDCSTLVGTGFHTLEVVMRDRSTADGDLLLDGVPLSFSPSVGIDVGYDDNDPGTEMGKARIGGWWGGAGNPNDDPSGYFAGRISGFTPLSDVQINAPMIISPVIASWNTATGVITQGFASYGTLHSTLLKVILRQ